MNVAPRPIRDRARQLERRRNLYKTGHLTRDARTRRVHFLLWRVGQLLADYQVYAQPLQEFVAG